MLFKSSYRSCRGHIWRLMLWESLSVAGTGKFVTVEREDRWSKILGDPRRKPVCVWQGLEPEVEIQLPVGHSKSNQNLIKNLWQDRRIYSLHPVGLSYFAENNQQTFSSLHVQSWRRSTAKDLGIVVKDDSSEWWLNRELNTSEYEL